MAVRRVFSETVAGFTQPFARSTLLAAEDMATKAMPSCILNPSKVSGLRQLQSSAATGAAPSMLQPRGGVGPQTLIIRAYRNVACLPYIYYRQRPVGLGLLQSFELLERHLASEWLRRDIPSSASAVHPIELRTLEDCYELHTDCPGMAEEDIQVELSPDRVITIAGGRRTSSRLVPASGSSAPPGKSRDQPAAAAGATEEAAPAADGSPEASGTEPSPDFSYRFQRSFVLPEDADTEGVVAALERGVLTISVPRKVVQSPQPRRIRVASGAGVGTP